MNNRKTSLDVIFRAAVKTFTFTMTIPACRYPVFNLYVVMNNS